MVTVGSKVNAVVDNSVAIAWAYPKQRDAYAERLLKQLYDVRFHVPSLWPMEFVNATCMLVNRGQMSTEMGAEMIGLGASFGFSVDGNPVDMAALFEISQRFQLTAYDAAYLELAIRLNAPLATRDGALTKAAKQLKLYFA